MAADDGFGEGAAAAGTGGATSAARFRLPIHAASAPMAAMPSQMRAKQMPCAMVNCSPKKATASTSAMVGLTYWMKPITVSEMRLAAAENSSSGMAVSTPQPASSAMTTAGPVTAIGSGVAGTSCQIHGAAAPRSGRRRR